MPSLSKWLVLLFCVFYPATAPADNNTPQHFKENPYFKNKVLIKEYKLKKPWSGPQTDGVYDEMLDASFDHSADLECGTCKIEWKGEDKNIVAKYPRKDDPDDEELDADFGSFFKLFEEPEDKYNVSMARGIRSGSLSFTK